jgi:ABC-type dipeptide/oligopeptide/nickel transport system permease component
MAAAFMTVNLAVDLLYARVDPRVKLGSGSAG